MGQVARRRKGPVDVVEVAETDAHIVVNGSGDGDADSNSEDGVRQCDGKEISIAEKDQATGKSQNQRDGDKDGIGQVRDGEDERRKKRRGICVGQKAKEARQKDGLNKKLLCEGPEDVARIRFRELDGAARQAKSVELRGRDDG